MSGLKTAAGFEVPPVVQAPCICPNGRSIKQGMKEKPDEDDVSPIVCQALIAAAPDLLAACEAFVEAEHAAILDGQRAFSMYVDAIDAAKAAIAKARGQ